MTQNLTVEVSISKRRIIILVMSTFLLSHVNIPLLLRGTARKND